MAIRRAKQKEQVIAKLREVAPAGETFLATVHCETGMSPYLAGVLGEIPLVGLIVALTRSYYFITVTSEHVVLNSANRFTNRPGDVVTSWPRNQFPLSNVNRGKLWSRAYVQMTPGGKPKRLNIDRYWRSEFDSLLQAVNYTEGAAPAAPSGDAPTAASA